MRTIQILTSLVAAAAFGALAIFAFAQEPLAAANPKDRAPEITGGPWLNTKDEKSITLATRKGKPTLVAFWTFACSNCQVNLKPYERLLAKYRAKGVEMIAVHTPELDEEHDLDKVKEHIKKFKIDYPVVIDNDNANWNAWKIEVWPTLLVVDGDGIVRYHWVGELNWKGAGGEAKVAKVLDELLAVKAK